MAFDGDGVEQDYVAAANWHRIAIVQGRATAQSNFALMYENGEVIRQGAGRRPEAMREGASALGQEPEDGKLLRGGLAIENWTSHYAPR